VLQYVLRRIAWMVPTLLGISCVTFALIRFAPGDPSQLQFSADAPAGNAEAMIEGFRREHLLDQPLWRQYLHYLGPFDLGPDGHRWFGGAGSKPWNGLLSGDLGHEYLRPDVSVAAEIGERLQVTLPLALLAVLLAYLVAIPLGIYSAVRRGTPLEVASTVMLFLLHAVPTFWAAVLLQTALGHGGLGWFPSIGIHGKDAADLAGWASAKDTLAHAVLPVVCLAYGGMAYVSRQMRTGMLEAIGADYVRMARAKGLSESAVVLKHALRNSLIPVITLLGQVLPVLVGGSVLVETVFDIPGLGKYAFDGLAHREYDVVMGTVLISAVMTLAGFLLSDVLYALVDPRIRAQHGLRHG
jgi:peptide/nickel transport system permease protein